MSSYRELLVWQKAHQLVLHVYAHSRPWPDAERFGLTSQIRRAAVSIPANVAEGATKRGFREFRRFLDIAAGSRAEVEYMLQLAGDLGYLTPEVAEALSAECDEVGRLLWGLHRSIRTAS